MPDPLQSVRLCEASLIQGAEFGAAAAEAFLLKNVRILGVDSENKGAAGGKRKYLIEALQRAVPLFEGQGVNLNHDYSILESGRPRKYTDRIGVLKNVRCDAEGLFGDLELNPHMPLSEAVRWDYQHGTKKVGMSFLGAGSGPMGTNVISEIKEVLSVDVVQNPSTTQSLREAEETEGEPHFGKTEHSMLLDHHQRLAECETKLSECMNRGALEEAAVKEQVKQLLSEVAQLRQPKDGGVHIHPKLEPDSGDMDAFIKSISRTSLPNRR